MDPHDLMRRFSEMLEQEELPPFTSALHDLLNDEVRLGWPHGLSFCFDLDCEELEPLDDDDRDAIVRGPEIYAPVDVYVPGSADDPRDADDPPGVRIHRGPPLHPDDLTVVHGIPTTTPSRTLIDLAECMSREELHHAFAQASKLGLLDRDALLASRARVEWRPSLAMFDEVAEEFID